MFLLNQSTHRMTVKYDEDIGHAWVPNQRARVPHERGAYVVATNAAGFRSDVQFVEEKGDRPRILFFGDSMTAGDGCSNAERFSECVARILDAEAYNYGLSGTGTDQQSLIYAKYAQGVDADLVVLGVYVENLDRNLAAFRPIIDRISGQEVLIPKPYFDLTPSGDLVLRHVPVPRYRPERGAVSDGVHGGEHRDANPQLKWVYQLADRIRSSDGLSGVSRVINPRTVDEHGVIRSTLLRLSRFDPLPDYADESSKGRRLLEGILNRFIQQVRGKPLLIVPIPMRYHLLDGVKPTYRDFFAAFDRPRDGVHVLDLTAALTALPLSERRRLSFQVDNHLSPFGHERVGQAIAELVRERKLIPARDRPSRERPGMTAASKDPATYVLGVSCFYHNSAAAIIKNGEIVAAAEEERFSRQKNDRRYPVNSINFCLEQAGIDASQLTSIVYYDNAQLTFERLLHTAAEVGAQGESFWRRMLPSWLIYKLDFPGMVRRHLKYEGEVLQERHHRSHAASAFYPSPYERAAILTIDGVGEWATAAIGVGRGSSIQMVKEMTFPNSLGLLYSAFTQFTGFKVNSGEYKMMGLAPYGVPRYADLILKELVDLKEDGSLELNMKYFGFLSDPSMTNDGFGSLFGGAAREPESRITRREMDIARSIQWVTEEAMLRMAKTAKNLTGETRLCMAGGVALNCVANGRILREGPFDEIWIQPAAGDSGCSLGAALDVYHTHLGMPRVRPENGRPLQGGSYWGPGFSEDEIGAFLHTHGYPHEKLPGAQRADRLADHLAQGSVVGHFEGRTEFGPRSLGARSILGDPRDQDMQVKLNLKIKYRESFRPFAPSVLAECVSDYFELEHESPYMLLVAPVRASRRLPFERGDGDDMLEVVRQPRSDLPAITHIDYSARVQSVHPADNPSYHALIQAFGKRTGCYVLVNTSFNVRGEPIVNTPFDAYRCFMRTEMDVLALGDYVLLKSEQPSWPEEKGHIDEYGEDVGTIEDEFTAELQRVFRDRFLPAVAELKRGAYRPLVRPFRQDQSTWQEVSPADDSPSIFSLPGAPGGEWSPADRARGIVRFWRDQNLGRALEPVVTELFDVLARHRPQMLEDEEVSDTMYVMF